ncbi:MAG: hypothetical protein ACE5G1_00265 [bacterium]
MSTQTVEPGMQTENVNKISFKWLIEYFQKNPVIMAWQIILVVGGLVLTVHFLYIGFWPDLDFESSLVLLAVVALTGLVILLFFSFYLIFPAFTWSIFLLNSETGKKIISHLKKQEAKNSHKSSIINPLRVLLYFGIPTLSAYFAFVLTVSLEWSFQFTNLMTTAMIWFFLIPLLLGSVICYFAMYRKPASEPTNRISLMQALIYLGTILIGCVILLTSLLFLQILMESPLSTLPANDWTLIWAILLALSINLGALRLSLEQSSDRKSLAVYVKMLLLGVIFFFIVTSMTSTWLLIPEGIVRLYGLGNLETADLILSSEGCTLVKELGENMTSKNESNLCRLQRVSILNRLGGIYYLESSEGVRYTIPSKMVMSYTLSVPVHKK